MARKIGILGVDQQSGEPRTYVKKSIAILLVRRCLAVWVEKNVLIRERQVKTPLRAVDVIRHVHASKPYIPDKLPSPEVKGVFFEDPRRPYRPVQFNPPLLRDMQPNR